MHSSGRIMFSFGCCVILVFASGCAWGRQRSKERNTRDGVLQSTRPRSVGIIALVNEEERFVLIDNGSQMPPPSGAALKSFTNGTESGVLSVGSVRRRPFFIADIVKGAPKKGDEVFQ